MSSLPTIQNLLIEEFGLDADKVAPETRLEELGVDSLATVEFMFLLEDKFKFRMGGQAADVKTVGDIAREVDLMLAQKAAAEAGQPGSA